VPRLRASVVVALSPLVFLIGCGGGGEHEGPPPTDTGLTGILSEQAFKALHEHTSEAPPPPTGESVSLSGGRAYLSLPEGDPPFPAIIVIHEWWGLNDNIRHWADRLAADGYAALAVDLYDGKITADSDQALEYAKSVHKARALEILRAAYRFLDTDARVRADRIGTVGWCFGGGYSLQAALNLPDLDATVIYYGRLVTDPDALRQIEAPICGVFGNRDQGIPPPTVDAFADALEASDREFELHRFDAEHAFANPSSARYDADASTAAWIQVRRFLARHLKETE